VDPLP